MWPLSIIELNIGINSPLEVRFRCVVLTIDFLFFECGEKEFSHSIVMRFAGIGKGLYHRILMFIFSSLV